MKSKKQLTRKQKIVILIVMILFSYSNFVFCDGDCSFQINQTALGQGGIGPIMGTCLNNPCTAAQNQDACNLAGANAISVAVRVCADRLGCTSGQRCIARIIGGFTPCVFTCLDRVNPPPIDHICKATTTIDFNCRCRLIPFTGSITPTSGCIGTILTASSNFFGSSIQWFLNDTAIAGANQLSILTTRAGTYDAIFYMINNDSDFVLTNSAVIEDCPMPVELASFTSGVNGKNIVLNWTTASEQNNSGFDIERRMFNVQLSMFNEQWEKIGFVEGSGNSNSQINYSYEDKNLSSGRYQYRLKQIDYNGNFRYYDLQNEVIIGTPDEFTLHQNYPNPFNPITRINYDIPNDGNVTIKIFDVSGKEVVTIVNEFKSAGYWTVEFDGSNFASGVYFYQIQSGDFVDVKKMIILK